MTLFGKTVVLMMSEISVNILVWIVAVLVFRHSGGAQYRRTLSLALVAWTTGLRHGLDADHISAIDNATRRIVSAGDQIRRPVTVGLFFSLGHSTIVFATTIAVAVSVGVADHLDVYGNVGGVIGAAISGSFLVLIGCINSFILYRTYRRLCAAKRGENTANEVHFNGLITRLAMPILRSVDRPWKLYPVGLLFGLGFDTASSIALLSAAILAQQGEGGNTSDVILLAFLFTAGMTLVDSADSCLMIWAYAPDTNLRRSRFAIRQKASEDAVTDVQDSQKADTEQQDDRTHAQNAVPHLIEGNETRQVIELSASKLSILLTLLSIMIAFAIGVIVLLGLIGDRCSSCSQAADRQEESGNGGLAGRWWLTWRRANENSGYVGAGIVGVFAVLMAVWFVSRYILSKRRVRSSARQ